MNRIFCLETEWDHSKHDLKMKSAVLPLLEFAENKYNLNVPHTFRQVATDMQSTYIRKIHTLKEVVMLQFNDGYHWHLLYGQDYLKRDHKHRFRIILNLCLQSAHLATTFAP